MRKNLLTEILCTIIISLLLHGCRNSPDQNNDSNIGPGNESTEMKNENSGNSSNNVGDSIKNMGTAPATTPQSTSTTGGTTGTYNRNSADHINTSTPNQSHEQGNLDTKRDHTNTTKKKSSGNQSGSQY